MSFCRNCGAKLNDGDRHCTACGAAQFDDTPQTVFCRHCGAEIDSDCIICPKCGKQVQDLRTKQSDSQPTIVINNTNQNSNENHVSVGGVMVGKQKNKWVAFFLCFFLGFLGAHKFYEEKIGQGLLYLFTGGLLSIGWIIDTIAILFKPNPYYV